MTDAPDLCVSGWLNADHPIQLRDLRGKVVVIEVFQMLCPSCVSHGLPQAKRIAETFNSGDVVVLGLHSVFEHHDVQGRLEALEAFVHEYRIDFPIAIDAPSDHRIPKTMAAYSLQGTPTLLLIDRRGHLRKNAFGAVSDMTLGAEIMALLNEETEQVAPVQEGKSAHLASQTCEDEGCPVPADKEVQQEG